MAFVRGVLSTKGSQVVVVDAGETVVGAAKTMNERGIGGLVVTESGRVSGIFTERDILRRVVAERRDPAATRVRDVMTSPVATCRPETTLAECRAFMTEKRIRHLPVVDDKGLCGIVTIGDLLAYEVGERESTIEYLSSYIFGPR